MDEKKAKGKQEALQVALSSIEKQFGPGSIMKIGEGQKVNIEAIPTGSLSLNLALGIGGVPKGRVVEIFGPEMSGKTTLALHIVREAQKKGGICAFIDAEHAFDADYAQKIGVNIDELLISQPDTGEQALEITETLVRSNAVDLIVVDSVAALVPQVEIEGEMGDAMIGVQARLMSQALRKLTGAISKTKTCLIFINQIRMKIGIMFGNPETTTGGLALKFYSSVRLDIRRGLPIKDGEQILGSRVKVKVVKNKVAPPFKIAEFDLMFADGIAYEGDILDLALKYALLQQLGSWIAYGEVKIGQGRQAAIQYLKDHPNITKQLEEKIQIAYKKNQ
ncbi:MAG: recombinase RecA [Candidatus Nealsonbacteria bacterium CG23_combo_of_CG06-09_8_20_14_all_40_13]|uniref:Protein RecA n=1 Tax=Candidatus Nealsonbacteria bacterium CG23_combo_of_CG06-09_8_20_14_all_40_13 TaxID=1974724 RepID=A0A2G9YSQ0_9BACT|nr:MAG: recombinase RecA [Candidatus Nealsonbacteria bacterium CG23_combo_of_CG06-09_8_20_14_all_40_13]PIR70881.1 MAG: recombinase RecA [Candidatus Nealsonbacteria bacterium CG10_big_fil_rev_8_21_14_0_10_40_24]